ncbi:DUF882 domain-containing protein [Parvibaculum sp.]|uniref:DUF882 domain-containing protein n=1 Tax=Parvibaculum sp. TaxID=2024848 RepID=UPI002BEA19A5|nr:DUF882 domain-containing protein [Parvibaculum sp.]HUD53367.1 DUF882 domain-containing protein [Parvibaculum sp.]
MDFTRRGFLGTASLAVASLAIARPAMAAVGAPRKLELHNIHTGESFATTYWADGAYVPGAMAGIRKVLRDHRDGSEHDIDPRLLDLLAALRGRLDTTARYEVISGYRSPHSNGLMHKASSGVAKRSLHMEGRAIDIRVPGRDLKLVHKAALALKSGGVGYYPKNDFVHVDCGKVRHWGGTRDV